MTHIEYYNTTLTDKILKRVRESFRDRMNILKKAHKLTVFLRVYSEVMLSSSSIVKADKSRLQPWHSSTLHWW